MIARLRVAGALALFCALTPPLFLWQLAALALPFLDERRVPRLWNRFVLRLLGLTVKVAGAPAAGRPLLIVANHVSWTDIMALRAHADLRFVAKAEVAGWPLFGALARVNRTVFVDRGARASAGAQAGELARELAKGMPLVLFPEGTSSDGTHVLPFKTSLFAAAAAPQAGGLIVQPVAIVYTRRDGIALGRRGRGRVAWIGDQTLVPHLLRLLRHGGLDAELRFGEAFAASAMDRKAIAARAHRDVSAMVAAILDGR